MCVGCISRYSESDHNLGLKIPKIPVLPHKILRGAPVQSRPDLLDPKGFLCLSFSVCFILSFFLSITLRHTHSNKRTHIKKTFILKGRRETKRNMAPVIFSPFNWDSAGLSVTETPEGRTSSKGRAFHTLLSFATESSNLSSHPLNLSFLSVFTLLSCSQYLSTLIYSPFSIFHKVWRLDNALLSKLACQRRRKRAEFGCRKQGAAEMDGCLKVEQKSTTSDQHSNCWGWTGSCKHKLTFIWLNDFYCSFVL